MFDRMILPVHVMGYQKAPAKKARLGLLKVLCQICTFFGGGVPFGVTV
jgi:hypothetical protein